MIVLDTNVLSAVMQTSPDKAVVKWLDSKPAESLWITSVTIFEIRFGLMLLPAGKRSARLEELFERMLKEGIEQRILPFDAPSARQTAALAASRQQTGRSVDLRDTMIAGIALSHKASVATRNIRHFSDLSVPAIDPWAI